MVRKSVKSASKRRGSARTSRARTKTGDQAPLPSTELKAAVDEVSEIEEEDGIEDGDEPGIGRERTLVCPFCSSVVLRDLEYSFETFSTSFCEHLVALHSWGCGSLKGQRDMLQTVTRSSVVRGRVRIWRPASVSLIDWARMHQTLSAAACGL